MSIFIEKISIKIFKLFKLLSSSFEVGTTFAYNRRNYLK